MKALFTLIFLFVFAFSFGQFKEPKFGKVEMTELSMNRYDKDSTSEALILFDDGNASIELNAEVNFQIVFQRHLRIKIFKKAAFHLADVSVRLYSGNNGKELMRDIKAITFNLENGKIVQTKLDKDNIFQETSKNYVTTKFAFPQVKEGSVIDLSYTIISDFLYNFRGWVFQYDYPAMWSQYSYTIPEYFNYRKSSKGYLPFDINKEEPGRTTYNIHNRIDGANSPNGIPAHENFNVEAQTMQTIIAVKDVPAFKMEPNIDCKENYLQAIEFELSSTRFPNGQIKSFAQTWASVNQKMLDDPDFGGQLKSRGFIDDTVAAVCKGKATNLEKASAIYSYVQNRMKWNGRYSLWAVNGLKKPYTDRTGNSAEINLLLTVMMQMAGLEASPVLFSTRDNGIAMSFIPTISKYNSVLSRVVIDGNSILLDAANPYCPFGVLPANDINGQGREVNNSGGDWADLNPGAAYKEYKIYKLKLTAEGVFKGIIQEKYEGYAAVNMRNYLGKEKSTDDFYRKIQENNTGLTISNYSVSGKDDINNPLTDSLNVEIGDCTEALGNKILFQPLLFEAVTKNNYKLEDRKYPVNYNYPFAENYIFEYTIPEGYEVESVPGNIILQMPDKSIVVSYSIQQLGNKLILVYKRNINKIVFLPSEYETLKEFYNQMVNKHSEKVILKKSA